MKRNEIKTGMELYYDRSTNWQEGSYSGGAKAVVVDDKRYRINKQTWGFRDATYSEDPKGTAVLVDLHRRWGAGETRVERTAVPATHLRGPWEKLRAEIAARQEDQRQANKRAEAERQGLHARAALAKERAKTSGFKVDVHFGYGSNRTYVEVSVDEFEKLLDLIAGAAVSDTTTKE